MINNNFYGLIDIDKNTVLVVTKTYLRSEYYMSSLLKDLKKKGKNLDVIFDFFVRNGSKDRFYYSYYDFEKSRIDIGTFKHIIPSDSTIEKADKFLKEKNLKSVI